MELLFGNQKVVEADVPQPGGEQVRCAAAAAGHWSPQSLCRSVRAPHMGLFLLPKGACECTHQLLIRTSNLAARQVTLAAAMAWARDNLLTERLELFMKGSSV